jgi:hypothetical protein
MGYGVEYAGGNMNRIISFSIILILTIIITACAKTQNKVDSLSRVYDALKVQDSKAHLLLYFPDNKFNYLIPENRLVKINESIEKSIVEELIKGPINRKIKQWFLNKTRILNISGRGNVLTIDFSKEFIKSLSFSKISNIYIIDSIVNSLTELPGVKKVLFKVVGGSIGIAGGIDFSKPFERNRKLFNRDKSLKPNEVLQREMSFEKEGKWLDSYLFMSDDENNVNRKYYDAYVQEMSEMQYNGFLNTNFWVGNYKLDITGKKASVEVNFNRNSSGEITGPVKVAYFNTVKIEDVWMVDWLTGQ